MKLHRRLLALLLCVVMVLGMLPASVFAADEPAPLQSINFRDPAAADQFTVVNPSVTKINEGEGLYLISTRPAFETCNGQNSGDQATNPQDAVSIPVSGDWTATMKFKFSTGSAANGYYQFFGFYAAEGDDYQNMAGIRGGDGALQDFLRVDGTITADSADRNSSPGMATNGASYWFRIAKSGDTYTCYRSEDGASFKEIFSYADTGIEADRLLIDAYTGMTEGYTYNVEYLYFGDDNEAMNKFALESSVNMILDKIPEIIPIRVNNAYNLPKGGNGLTVSYTAEPDCIQGYKIIAMEKETAVKLTVNISTGGVTVSKELNVTVPAAGTSTIPNPTYKVTFNPNVSGMESVVVEVDEEDTVEVPASLSRKGYAATWRQGNSNFNFSTPITQDITLTANWSKDWNQMWSLGDEYADYFPFGNFGTQSPNGGQVEREYRTFSGNSGKMTYNFGANESKNAYNQAVSAINADTSLTQEEKDAKILEAEGKVMLGGNNPLQGDLNRIQSWNEQHPDQPKKYYRQHVIAWHGSEQNAAFYHMGFDTSKPLATKEIMNARLDSYIEAMFKRYQPWDDIIMSWDIVNEALDDYTGMVRNGWNGSSWGETSLDDASSQSSAWGTIYRMKDENGNPVKEMTEERLLAETEWIRVAFASARKWQKELGVHWKLYYNDYMNSSMLYEPKMTNTLKILKPIYEAGNLDGYGMQARLSTAYPGIDLLRYQIEEGLKVADEVSFSEGDVRTDFEVNPLYDPEKPTRRVVSGDEEWDQGGSGSYNRRSQQNGNTYDVSNGPVRRKSNFNANDAETMRLQADYYADLMDIMLEKAELGKVGAIAIDGTSDGNTFNRGTGCQIWDSSNNEKPAFFAVIGAPNRLKMNHAIEAGPALSESAKYTAESWAPYAAALTAAQELVDVRIYNDAAVTAVVNATEALVEATAGLVEAPAAAGGYVLAETIEPGKNYVIVANDGLAVTNAVTAVPVTVEDGKITSEVTDDMLWSFKDVNEVIADTPAASNGSAQYFIFAATKDADNYLQRGTGSGGESTAAIVQVAAFPNTARWARWSFEPRADGSYTMYVNTERDHSSDYAFTLNVSDYDINCTNSYGPWDDLTSSGSSIRLYELVEGSANLMIDFTDPAAADEFEVINKKNAAIVEGTGLTLTATRPAFETCNGQNSGDQATNPEDVVVVPVSGDFEATLEFDFSQASAANGYYQFFGFYAGEGDDYQNLAGIRGGDGAMQNFLRVNGEITADSADLNSQPGLASNGTYWYKLVKEGDTYTCQRSADGEEFTDMFVYEGTGIEADRLIIDAYTGMTEGYQFTLKNLEIISAGAACEHKFVEKIVAPTCTEEGYTELVCSKCGKTKKTDKVAALGHDWGEGVVITAATETTGGVIEYTCKRCGEKKTEKTAPTKLVPGPTVVKDPESPTGYTVQFVYYNETAKQVNFACDCGLKNELDRTDSKQYTPWEYKPGLMRSGGFTAPMEEIADGYWYYELPLAAGANQYWFQVDGNTDYMVPDPANAPYWSPNSASNKNAYNVVYVPYDEKQAYEPLRLRAEAENPKNGSDRLIPPHYEDADKYEMGTWWYEPVEISGRTHYMGVYLPYGYDADRAEPYKTIYILHGGGQDESDWVGMGSVQNILDNLIAEGRTEPAVLIAPTSNNNMIGGTGDNYANLFNAIIPYVEEHFNVSTDKMDRAFAGLSMGSMNTQNIINSNPVDAEGNPVDKFGYYGPWSGGCSVTATAPGIEYAHILFAGGYDDFGNPSEATVNNLKNQGVYCLYKGVSGAHDFSTWCQMFRIFCDEYLWKAWMFGDGEAPAEPETDLKPGPNVIKDPASPTGYTVKFLYENETATSVTFAGDIGLRDWAADTTRNKGVNISPFDYKPGMMRCFSFTDDMVKLTEGKYAGWWYYEVPLAAGANQYWFYIDGNTNYMAPDPNNMPAWSPRVNASTKNAYNTVYVPYDAKQDFEPMKAREAENPRTDGKVGTWSYVQLEYSNGAKHYAGVYLPYGYDADRAEPYKTIYMLHGFGQDESDWMGIGSVQKIMDNLAAEGRTEPAVIVSVTSDNGMISSGGGFFGGGSYGIVETELIPAIEKLYNVSNKAEDRAWMGLSMGSMNTQNMINGNAPLFGYYGAFSGGCSVSATTAGLDKTHIVIGYGSDDSTVALTDAVTDGVKAINDNGGYAAFEYVCGGHDFNAWCQLFRIVCENYLWKPEAFGDVGGDVPHEHKYSAVVTAPTCTEEGFTTYTCECGDTYVGDKVAALGHDLKESTVAATCTEAGSITVTCSRCDYKTVTEIPALGHDYVNGICQRCGDKEVVADFFEDVLPGTFCFDAIKWAVDNEITKGIADGIFAPSHTVTRGQIVTFLWRAAGMPEPEGTADFVDLKEGAFYTKAVAWAVENGITDGVGHGKFAPDSVCTRGQIVTFLWRYMGKPAATAPAAFKDVDAGAFYADAVAWAVEAGVTTGITEELFKPKNDCTRAQAVTFIMRAIAK